MTAEKLPQYLAAISASAGGFVIGTILAWTFVATTLVEENHAYGFQITWDHFSWIGSLVAFGAVLGCIVNGLIINFIGSKISILLSNISITTGWLLIIFAQNIWMIFIGRGFLGLATGMLWVSIPIYVGEISQKEIRGSLATLFQLMISLGILFIYVTEIYTNISFLSIICTIIPLVLGITVFVIPESSIFLVSKGRTEDAIKSIKLLKGKNYDYKSELNDLEMADQETKQTPLQVPKVIKSFLIASGLMFFQQMSGLNAVIFYSYSILQQTSYSISSYGLFAIIIGVMQVMATLLSALLIDKVGRRPILLISQILMVFCSFIIGGYFFLRDAGTNVTPFGWISMTAVFVFILSFSFGMGPAPFVILSEIFPTKIKGIAVGLSGVVNWILVFVVTKYFSILIELLNSYGTFWLFSIITALGSIFIFFYIPETKGKSLRKIQEDLIEVKDYYV